jgi:uracil-DNA glycosylase
MSDDISRVAASQAPLRTLPPGNNRTGLPEPASVDLVAYTLAHTAAISSEKPAFSRRECAELWRKRMFAALPNLELILLVGQYAQKWRTQARKGRRKRALSAAEGHLEGR